jgi:hypothetical protein
MMTAGIVSDVELAPWFLANLTDKLKNVVSSLPVLVPEEFYLPAPPLYCPQAGEEEMVKYYIRFFRYCLKIICISQSKDI